MTVVNIEQGMPTVEVAHRKLEQAVRTAKARKVPVLKIIHGYGSSGKGGAIKRDVSSTLSRMSASGEIHGFVSGEDFSPFNESARKIIDKCPELRRDSDYTRGNHGITMVLI